MKNWKEVRGVVTPGGDAAWICPVCGDKSRKSYHVYGIEHLKNKLDRCPCCGERLKYPWEKEITNKFQEIAETMKFTELPTSVVANSDFEQMLRRNADESIESSPATVEPSAEQDKENPESY